MTSIATLGPRGSDACQAVLQYDANAQLALFNHIDDIVDSVASDQSDLALIPVYNTREGEIKEYFRVLTELENCYWVDNIVLPIHLSLGGTSADQSLDGIETIYGRSSVLRQCTVYISRHIPDATLISVHNIDTAIDRIKADDGKSVLIETEEIIHGNGLFMIDRELVPHNRTRFAIIGKNPHPLTGYDATSVLTRPLPDRVGLLVDTLNEFAKRGINIIDLRSENDIETQKLQIYLEIEGHRDNQIIADALHDIETRVIQEPNCLNILGSFPRVDMRVKKIKTFGFIGSGDMSRWFSDQLRSEGYDTIITGRTSELRPEEMIDRVEVVIICVPISATAQTVSQYGPLLKDGQALIILAGESEHPLEAAIGATSQGVEIMLVHNLWGPQVVTMKDKNVSVVKTRRSGSLCYEFVSFLYKYGAEIYNDSAEKHDLMMGVSQKLPTAISVALAKTLTDHQLDFTDIDTHSTLTSLYGILAMTRVHSQNARTYAEIMATGGEGKKIIESFITNLQLVSEMADQRRIDALSLLIDQNKTQIPIRFIRTKMNQAQAVDAVLSDIGFKGE